MDDYLFSRKNSPFFYYRLQNPPRMAAVLGWKVKVKSTGERDHHRALQVALADIIEHKKLLAATKAHDLQASGRIYAEREFQPNEERFGDDGSKAICTNDGLQIVHTDAAGRMNVRPNPTVTHLKLINSESDARQIEVLERLRAKPSRDIDEEIFQNWAKNKSQGNKNVVRKFMRTLHEIAPNKSLATISTSDVKALEAKLVLEGNASTSLHSKFGLASAMVNAAIDDDKFPMLKANPFKIKNLQTRGIKGRRPENRLFDDNDFARIAKDLSNWPDDLRLYWTMLRTMGGRRSEPTQVIGEETVSGYRCVEYGTKDETAISQI